MANPTKTKITKPKTRSYPQISRHVTPTDFRLAFHNAQGGNPERLYAILKFFMKMDDEIPAAMQSLTSAIIGEEMVVTPLDDFGDEGKRQADAIGYILSEMDFVDLAEHLLQSHYYGFTAAAIPGEAWDMVSYEGRSYQAPTTYEVLPQDWIHAKKEDTGDDYTTIYVGSDPYYTYPAGNILLSSFKKLPSYENIDFTDFGCGLGCIRFAVFKYFNEEDAAAFNEVFSTPLILGKVGQGGQKDVVKRAVKEMASDSRAVIGENDDISFPQANTGTVSDVYDTSAHRWNKAIAKKIKSESLTDNMGSSGSYAAMYTVNGVRLDVASMLARKLKKIVQRRIIRPLADLNWNGRIMTEVNFPVQGIEDLVQQINVDGKLMQQISGSEAHLRDKYNFPAPADDEDTVRPRRGLGGLGV